MIRNILLGVACFTFAFGAGCGGDDTVAYTGNLEVGEDGTPVLNLEPPEWFTNKIGEIDIHPHGQALSDDLGQATQPYAGAEFLGYAYNNGSNPGFLDLPTAHKVVGICGLPPWGNLRCIQPKSPTQKSVWRWRWRRGFEGEPYPNCFNMNSDDTFLDGLRDAAAEWSKAGIFVQEATGSQVEDITFYCDGAATDSLDPNHNMAAVWFPYGTTSNTGGIAGGPSGPTSANVNDCFPDDLDPGQKWFYSQGAVVLNPTYIDNFVQQSWQWCKQPAALTTAQYRRVAKFIGMHTLGHHFGFPHLNSIKFMKSKPTCNDVVNTTQTMDTTMSDLFKAFDGRYSLLQNHDYDKGLDCKTPVQTTITE